jgi:hypothetical protein
MSKVPTKIFKSTLRVTLFTETHLAKQSLVVGFWFYGGGYWFNSQVCTVKKKKFTFGEYTIHVLITKSLAGHLWT